MPLRDQNVDLSDTVRERRKKEKSWEDQRFEVYEEKPSKMVRWVMRYSGGYIKNQGQAYAVLWAAAIVFFLLALVIFFFGVRESVDERYIYNPETDITDDVTGRRVE